MIELESGPVRDSASGILAVKLTDHGDFESALAWAGDQSDSVARSRLAESILVRAIREDSFEAAEAFLKQSGLSLAEKQALHEKLISEH